VLDQGSSQVSTDIRLYTLEQAQSPPQGFATNMVDFTVDASGIYTITFNNTVLPCTNDFDCPGKF